MIYSLIVVPRQFYQKMPAAQTGIQRVLLLTVVVILATITEGQNQRRKLSRSPFSPPANADVKSSGSSPHQRARYDVQGGNSAHGSPFTPPHDYPVRELTTQRIITTPAPAVRPIPVVNNIVPQSQEPSARSPFTPPPQKEWQDGGQAPFHNERRQQWKPRDKPSPWLNALEQRQYENADSIPPISTIDVNNNDDSRRRKRLRHRPRVSTYQDNHHGGDVKDMHDVGPGVTPWTRYTEKPRVHDDNSGSGSRRARCGRQRYNPRNQICCQGHVERRIGVSPACCGTQAYDTVYNKCCNGVVSIRANGEPDC